MIVTNDTSSIELVQIVIIDSQVINWVHNDRKSDSTFLLGLLLTEDPQK